MPPIGGVNFVTSLVNVMNLLLNRDGLEFLEIVYRDGQESPFNILTDKSLSQNLYNRGRYRKIYSHDIFNI